MKELTLIALSFYCLNAYALKIKLATIVPKGTNWAKTLQQMSKEIKKKTAGKVKVQIYYGGGQGDEPDVLRKIRVGQLHGGVFTGNTLGDIYSDVRILEVPFNFYNNEQKALTALNSNAKFFSDEIRKKGFENLGFYGIGKVYVVSTKKVSNIAELKGVKMWAWEGDQLVKAMMDSLQLVSVPLALPDVMSSLSTGIIEAAYAPPLGILALQWQNKVKYIVNYPTAYSIGALLVSNKRWKKLSADQQKIVKDVASKYVKQANDFAVEDNKKSLATLKEIGVEFVQFSEKEKAQAEKIRSDVINKLKGKYLSESILKKLESMR